MIFHSSNLERSSRRYQRGEPHTAEHDCISSLFGKTMCFRLFRQEYIWTLESLKRLSRIFVQVISRWANGISHKQSYLSKMLSWLCSEMMGCTSKELVD